MNRSDVLARKAYQAYGDVVKWKNFRGDPMPKFDELPEPIRHAWEAASAASAAEAVRIRDARALGIFDQLRSALLSSDAPNGAEADCG